MSRTNIDIDDELIADVMQTYHLATKREAVDLALRNLRRRKRPTVEEMLALEGSGYDGGIWAIKDGGAVREF